MWDNRETSSLNAFTSSARNSGDSGGRRSFSVFRSTIFSLTAIIHGPPAVCFREPEGATQYRWRVAVEGSQPGQSCSSVHGDSGEIGSPVVRNLQKTDDLIIDALG
jgi:hypothetical protein